MLYEVITTTQVLSSDVSYSIVVPFFGGRDDIEALAYGMRMAEHPGIKLTVIKFVAPPGKSLLTNEATSKKKNASTAAHIMIDNDCDEEDEAFFSVV